MSECHSSQFSLPPLADHPDAWAVLTRLLHQLDACAGASDQLLEALQAIREAVGADVVYWHNEETGETLSTPPDHPLSPEGCQAVVRQLLARRAGGKGTIIWHNPHGATGKPHGLPRSAAAVRLHRSRPVWALALSSRRRLDGAAARFIGLAGAMLLKQRQHSWIRAEFKESLLGLLHCLAAVIEAKDSFTAGHSERVSQIAARIGEQMGLPGVAVGDLQLAGLLHDVGKVGVRDEVLRKPGGLTAAEQEHLRAHVLIGDRIVSTIKPFARLRPGVRGHHERYDGQGYPDGLAGEGIPLLARVLAVADSCDAMMSARRYRGPLPPPQIDAILLANAGAQWDPKVVEAFMACRHAIYPPIYQKGIGESGALAIDRIVEGLKDGPSGGPRLGGQALGQAGATGAPQRG
jgi:HD-GYP domain-containing protein (c-di-GMP phosphodiesterase class II)